MTEFRESVYIEPSIEKKSQEVDSNYREHMGVPVFSIVEFNLWGACNRKCNFCPVSDSSIWTNRHEGISEKDYEKVLEDLQELNYSGVILWSTFSEPLLHKNVLKLAKITKSKLPNAKLHVVTNGDVIRKRLDFLKSLFDSGVDKLQVSLYDGKEQFLEFEEIGKKLDLDPSRFELRRRYSDGENFGLTISNRAGSIDSNSFRSSTEKSILHTDLPLKSPCTYFFYQVVIDYNGDVILCAHDWKKELILGNAFDTNLWVIWTSKSADKVRLSLSQSNREFNPCIKCDVRGNLIGERHFENFKKILTK